PPARSTRSTRQPWSSAPTCVPTSRSGATSPSRSREPITAYVGEDGALVVCRGQRRALTAAKVGTPTGTVPVRVLERPEDAERIVAQVSENLHRAEMSPAEERDAIEQLALLGVS